ncbi:MAG: hypothetical protein E7B18_12335 [Clostridium sp.]|nr:hypothetical protein [Clostridium sp.]
MNRDLPKLFDEFVDARKNGFLAAKEFKENGGKLAGCLCSYTPQELPRRSRMQKRCSPKTCAR